MNKKIFYIKDIMLLQNFVEPLNYLDIGSRTDADSWFDIISKKLNKINFEAQDGSGLFNFTGTKKFFLTKEDTRSSLFKPNSKLKKFVNEESRLNYKEIDIKVDTIDNRLKNFQGKVDLIKIDTQGCEYEILEGGWNTIKKDMPFLFLETWSDDYYENIHLFEDIITKLRTINYDLYLMDVAASNRIDLKYKFSKNIGREKMSGFNLFLGPNLDYLLSINNTQVKIKKSFILFCHDLLTHSYKIVEKEQSNYKVCLEKIINKRIKYSYFYFAANCLKIIQNLIFKNKKNFFNLT